MNTKSLPVAIKAVGTKGGLEEGQVRAVVSVFDNIDSQGDVVMPGAFADDLNAWADSGDSIPFVWSHAWVDPFAHIGRVVKAQETTRGLEVVAEIMDRDTNPTAAQVYNLLKGRRVKQFSFAYDVVEGGWAERDGREVYELRKLHVFEVGPTLVGANQETELLAAKAAQLGGLAKAGVELSPTDRKQIEQARDDLEAILAVTGAKISDNPANPQREGVPDLDLPAGVAPTDGDPADPPPGRTVDEGSGIVHPDKSGADDAGSATATGQEDSPAPASTAPDGGPPAKAPELDPAQVRAWADVLLLTAP